MTPQPIDTAPPGDGWILGLVVDDTRPRARRHPWVILTRCDSGWSDDEGYSWSPCAWVPLPDPQPKPTGWRPPAGTVCIAPIVGGEIPRAKWIVYVKLPDGEADATREPYVAVTVEGARADAARWAKELGLPLGEDATSADVVAFPGKEARQ